MTITRRGACLAIVGFATLVARPASAQGWRTYRNPRFGTTVEYPDRFRPGRPPENGAGLGFAGPDGASFTVWGSHNALEQVVVSGYHLIGFFPFLNTSKP